MKKPKKKRGRPSKKRPEQTAGYWEKQLQNHRLGMGRAEHKWQVLQCMFVEEDGEPLLLESLLTGGSITNQNDGVASLYEQAAADASSVLPPPWLLYLEYMYIIAELLSPEDQGATLKEAMLRHACSCREEQPIDFSCAGTPAEFRTRCEQSRVVIQLDKNRKIINIIGYPKQGEP